MATSKMCSWGLCHALRILFFFFNDTATTEIYTLSLHDALPISLAARAQAHVDLIEPTGGGVHGQQVHDARSEEHTSELQSLAYLVCRLLLEKKKLLVDIFLFRSGVDLVRLLGLNIQAAVSS